MRNIERKRRGVSIVEVLIAFTILTVAILALLGVLPAAGRQSMSSDVENQALFIAQQKMDQILRNGVFIASSVTPTNPLPSHPALQMQLIYGGEPLSQGFGNMQRITVRVTWLEQGRARSVKLVGALAK